MRKNKKNLFLGLFNIIVACFCGVVSCLCYNNHNDLALSITAVMALGNLGFGIVNLKEFLKNNQ